MKVPLARTILPVPKEKPLDGIYQPSSATIAELFAAGVAPDNIARRLGMTTGQVNRRVMQLGKQWDAAVSARLETLVGREVALANMVSEQAFDDYLDSPNPVSLKLMLEASALRIKVQGLDKRMGQRVDLRSDDISDLLAEVGLSPSASIPETLRTTREEEIENEIDSEENDEENDE